MKRFLFLLLIITACTVEKPFHYEKISLAGEWRFRIDSLDKGIGEKWYQTIGGDIVKLPGSMAENGKGNEVSVNTKWTGDIVDKSYFTDEKYAKYRQPGNIKIPFWLKPVKYYKGAAWYQKELELPAGWKGKNVVLFLERPHWETTVFINGQNAGTGNSLAAPHEFNITGYLNEGKNLISIRVDNRMIIPVGVNSHSISDHTQSDWNGIAGDISLKATTEVYIDNIAIYPDVEKKSAKVVVRLSNRSGKNFSAKLDLKADAYNAGAQKLKKKSIKADINSDNLQLTIDYPLGNNMQLWDEFSPALYKMTVNLRNARGELTDQVSEDFGMREFRVKGTRFEVNGNPVFLRGTTECCIFPLTGYPPSDRESWDKVFRKCKDYGLNHMRFHSYCPPEAAFEAADRLGIYLHVECSSWANQGASIGDGKSTDQFIYNESDRIIREYGNHPSFCMLAYGNEPAGRNQKEFLGKLIKYWKSIDNRRVYTSAAGWPVIAENDYNLIPGPRIHQWGDGLRSIINAEPPQTMFDYSQVISKYQVPVVGHEIGQWCAYPDFKEIQKYTGILRATNFEIFRETLNNNNMGKQAEDFLIASGKLQSLCYKAEIEAALRTPGYAGFQMLQLHDFPGQGTALVGILNPFFEEKGYITAGEFRRFCNETVPLVRLPKLIYSNNDTIRGDIEVFHFGQKPLMNAVITCKIFNSAGDSVFSKTFRKDKIDIGNCQKAGSVFFPAGKIKSPQKLRMEVSIENTQFMNSWDLWVYSEKGRDGSDKVFVTDDLGKEAEDVLKKGGFVLLLNYGKIAGSRGAKIAVGFSSIFWNTAWTGNQAPHTLGILCNPGHPVFKDFPTEFHSNWQWWDPVMHSRAMIINDFPAELKPLIQPIDTWFENRRLALAFESKTSGGRLLVCSIDMKNIPDARLSSRQLLTSILNYMESKDFNPVVEISPEKIRNLAR